MDQYKDFHLDADEEALMAGVRAALKLGPVAWTTDRQAAAFRDAIAAHKAAKANPFKRILPEAR